MVTIWLCVVRDFKSLAFRVAQTVAKAVSLSLNLPDRQAGLLKDSQSVALARWKRGLDQKAFAFDCEIGRTQLYMIENGKTNLRLLTLIKIANGLEVSLRDLVKV